MNLARESAEYIVPTNKRVTPGLLRLLVFSHVFEELDGGGEDGDVSVGNNNSTATFCRLLQRFLPKQWVTTFQKWKHVFTKVGHCFQNHPLAPTTPPPPPPTKSK
jgi:hypothetical protein